MPADAHTVGLVSSKIPVVGSKDDYSMDEACSRIYPSIKHSYIAYDSLKKSSRKHLPNTTEETRPSSREHEK